MSCGIDLSISDPWCGRDCSRNSWWAIPVAATAEHNAAAFPSARAWKQLDAKLYRCRCDTELCSNARDPASMRRGLHPGTYIPAAPLTTHVSSYTSASQLVIICPVKSRLCTHTPLALTTTAPLTSFPISVRGGPCLLWRMVCTQNLCTKH